MPFKCFPPPQIEAIEKGTETNPTPDDIVNAHVGYFRLLDQEGIGATSAEVQLFRVDNDGYNQSRLNEDVWGSDYFKEDVDRDQIPKWRLQVKYRAEDEQYKTIPKKYEDISDYVINAFPAPEGMNADWWARQTSEKKRSILTDIDTDTMLAGNEIYRKDRRRIEAYGKDISEVEDYVEFCELPIKGKRRDRFLIEHGGQDPKNLTGFALTYSQLDKGHDIPTDVPVVEYDDLYDQFKDEFEKIEGISDQTSEFFIESAEEGLTLDETRDKARDAIRFETGEATYSGVKFTTNKLTEFGLAEIKRNGLKALIGHEEFIEDYVGFYTIISEGKPEDWEKTTKQDKWYEDDWFLMEHIDFYRLATVNPRDKRFFGLLDWERKVFSKVPPRAIFEKWLHYSLLPTGYERDTYRLNNPDLDEWGVFAGIWEITMSEKRRRLTITSSEGFKEEVEERLEEFPEKFLGR